MSNNTSQSYSSISVSSADMHPAPSTVRGVGDIAWRILIIATGYMLAATIAGRLLGRNPQWAGVGISLLSGILIGATLGPVAARTQGSRWRHLTVWGSALFLNALSVAIEGAFFAPRLNPMVVTPAPWIAFLLFQSLATAGLIAWLFGKNADSATPNPQRKRAWYSWAWRFVVSAFSYLLFYFIFGAVNYALVTKPYYETHASGLVVPAPQTVFMAEMARAPLIILSILPLILTFKTKKPLLALLCGIILFVIGGVIPLLLNTALPDLLRFASAIEIFFQNFLTGVAAALLLGSATMNDAMNE